MYLSFMSTKNYYVIVHGSFLKYCSFFDFLFLSKLSITILHNSLVDTIIQTITQRIEMYIKIPDNNNHAISKNDFSEALYTIIRNTIKRSNPILIY